MESKRAIVFANGELMDADAVRAFIRPDDYLVAADGGYLHMKKLGLKPHLLIGDLDSLPAEDVAELRTTGTSIEIFPREKDETDLELALTKLAGQGYSEIRVVAALGGRLDQTLANVYLLELEALDGIDVRLDDGHEEILVIHDKAHIIGTAGDTLSLLAMDGCTQGITTYNLKYPLNRETLCPSRSRGISNVMVGSEAIVELRSGSLLCIHTRQKA